MTAWSLGRCGTARTGEAGGVFAISRSGVIFLLYSILLTVVELCVSSSLTAFRFVPAPLP